MAEVDLYAPIKRFLEEQGYVVKGEVGACDIVALRGEEPPLVVELKERLNLTLVLQAVNRLAISESVYLAFRIGKGGSATWRSKGREVKGLLQRLGLGLLTVSAKGEVRLVLEPALFQPRLSPRRQRRLVQEFELRAGDPEAGGSSARARLTAYRQDALRCARELADAGPLKLKLIRERAGVERAGRILAKNHYGWFERVSVGHYELTALGQEGWEQWGARLDELEADSEAN